MNKVFNIKNFLFLLSITGIFLLPHITKAGVIPQPPNSLGLVGYWSFEDNQSNTTITDYSGNGNTGTMTNMDVTPANDHVTGYKSNSTALDFDGGDDYISVPNSNDWDFGTDDFTIQLWINADDLSAEGYGLLSTSNYVNPPGTRQNWWLSTVTTGKLQFYDYTNNTQVLQSNSSLTTGEWHMITFTRRSGSEYFYINGELDASGTYGAGISFDDIAMKLTRSDI